MDLHVDDAITLNKLAAHVRAVRGRLDRLDDRVDGVAKDVEEILDTTSLDGIRRAQYASYSSGRAGAPSGCLKGTRVDLLDLVAKWLADQDPNGPRIFWLNGIAGTGKSAIAWTVAHIADQNHQLAGSFFFSRRGEAELRDPFLVFPTIAYQLAHFDPEFQSKIIQALKTNPNAPTSNLKDQLDRVIVEPLSKVRMTPGRVALVVFDAFDECEETGAKEILQLLVDAITSLPFQLRIFITGRPEPHIRTTLGPSAILKTTILHEIERSVVQSDIHLFLTTRLAAIPKEINKRLPSDWVSKHEIDQLAEQAGNLFVWAATAMRFIGDTRARNPRRRLDILLGVTQSPGSNPFSGLDALYLEILENATSLDDPLHSSRLFQSVVGTLILLHDSLPEEGIERLVGLEDAEVSDTLYTLHSVIAPPTASIDHPQVYHPSFSDFLREPARCTDSKFFIDDQHHEARLVLCCFDVLEASLHREMMKAAEFPPELAYACRYWASHLSKVILTLANSSLRDALEAFVSHRLLWWLESMSRLGNMEMVPECVQMAQTWAVCTLGYLRLSRALTYGSQSTPPQSDHTSALLTDIHRFVLTHFRAISEDPSEIYRSALPFTPKSTALYKTYRHDTVGCINVLGGIEEDWPQAVKTWSVPSVASFISYSQDGKRIASAHYEHGLILRNVVNGQVVFRLGENFGTFLAMEFSPDGSQLAAASDQPTQVQLLDAVSGSEIRAFRCPGLPISLAFSSPGDQLAAGFSRGSGFLIWDIATGQVLMRVADPRFRYGVTAITFSPCRAHILTASIHSIQRWDLASKELCTLIQGFGTVSIKFSPDGLIWTACCTDRKIRSWREETGALCSTVELGELEAGSPLLLALTGVKAAMAGGHRVTIYDLHSGLHHLQFGDRLTALTLSPDGSALVCGRDDNTMEVWDLTRNNAVPPTKMHSAPVVYAYIFHDTNFAASVSSDNIINLWNTETGAHVARTQGPTDVTPEKALDTECRARLPERLLPRKSRDRNNNDNGDRGPYYIRLRHLFDRFGQLCRLPDSARSSTIRAIAWSNTLVCFGTQDGKVFILNASAVVRGE